MANGNVINVSGIEQVCQALDRAPLAMNHLLKDGLVEAGNVIAMEVIARTPVKTGLMKASVVNVVEVSLNGRGMGGRAQIGFGKQGFKARMIEYGHRIVGHKPGKKELGSKEGLGFMRAALEMSKDAAASRFVSVVSAGLKGKL